MARRAPPSCALLPKNKGELRLDHALIFPNALKAWIPVWARPKINA